MSHVRIDLLPIRRLDSFFLIPIPRFRFRKTTRDVAAIPVKLNENKSCHLLSRYIRSSEFLFKKEFRVEKGSALSCIAALHLSIVEKIKPGTRFILFFFQDKGIEKDIGLGWKNSKEGESPGPAVPVELEVEVAVKLEVETCGGGVRDIP